jgi:transcription elongation factor Elf1
LTELNQDIREADCKNCNGVRKCYIRGHHQKTYNDPDNPYSSWMDIYILQCRGCENLFVQKVEANSEDVDHYYDHDGSTISEYNEKKTYWPHIPERTKPEWVDMLLFNAEDLYERYNIMPETEDQKIKKLKDVSDLYNVMQETYDALDAGLPRLALIGMRTCFDVASNIMNFVGDFGGKLNEMVKMGIITNIDKDVLGVLDNNNSGGWSLEKVLVEAGNASAHRGWSPEHKEELYLLVDILEKFIEKAFISKLEISRIHAEAAKLRPKIPPRPPSKNNKKQAK